jgi:hypothetical protein
VQAEVTYMKLKKLKLAQKISRSVSTSLYFFVLVRQIDLNTHDLIDSSRCVHALTSNVGIFQVICSPLAALNLALSSSLLNASFNNGCRHLCQPSVRSSTCQAASTLDIVCHGQIFAENTNFSNNPYGDRPTEIH